MTDDAARSHAVTLEETPAHSSHQDPHTPRTSSGRVQRRRDRRRAEILSKATRCLISYGYQGFHLEEVADQADIAKATLYHYYPSKDALVSASLDHIFDQVMQRLEDRRDRSGATTAAELLRELIDEQLIISTDADTQDVAIFFYPGSWPASFDEDIKTKRRRHDSVIRAVAQRGVDDGEFTCPNLFVAMQCLHGILNQAPLWMRPGDSDEERRSARAAVVDSAMRLFV